MSGETSSGKGHNDGSECQDAPSPGNELVETAMEVSQEVNPSNSTRDSIEDNQMPSTSENIVVASGIRHRPGQFELPRDASLSDDFLQRNRMAADLYGTQGNNLLVQAELQHQQKPIFDPVTLTLQQRQDPNGERKVKLSMQTR